MFNPIKKLFKYKIPELTQYHGRTLVIDGMKVKVEHITGSAVKPAFYEINGKYLIGMLRFHAQIQGAEDITEEQFKEFEEMEMHCEVVDNSKDAKEVQSQVVDTEKSDLH